MNILLGLFAFIVNNAEPLSGLALPVLVDFLNKDVKTDRERFFIAAVASLVIALLIKKDDVMYGSPDEALKTWTLLFAESQAVFKLYFKNSGLRYAFQSLYQPSENNPAETTTEAMILNDVGKKE